jgi:hypothetical protein
MGKPAPDVTGGPSILATSSSTTARRPPAPRLLGWVDLRTRRARGMVSHGRPSEGREVAVAARGEAVLRVSFGPAATPVLPRAVAFAAQHAVDVLDIHQCCVHVIHHLAPVGSAHRASSLLLS